MYGFGVLGSCRGLQLQKHRRDTFRVCGSAACRTVSATVYVQVAGKINLLGSCAMLADRAIHVLRY